jgi:hypothetical protein
MNILSPEGLFTRDLPTGNLVWVDQVNGNDSLAVRGQRGIPFKTLTAAKNAAKPAVFEDGELLEAGDTIMVLPGLYDEKDLLRHGVNWYFFPGAVVHYTGNSGPIFATGSSGLIASVAGFGDFTADSNEVVNVSAGGADLAIQARRMEAPDTGCISVTAGSGTLKLQVADRIEGLYAVYKTGASACVVEADELEGSSYCISYNAGNLFVKGRDLTSLGSSAVKVGAYGSAGALVIDALHIGAGSDAAVLYEGSLPTLLIRNARITSASNSAVSIGASGSNKVQLMCCVGIAGSTADSIYAADDNTLVQIPGGWTCNRNVHDNVALIGGFIAPNSNIW